MPVVDNGRKTRQQLFSRLTPEVSRGSSQKGIYTQTAADKLLPGIGGRVPVYKDQMRDNIARQPTFAQGRRVPLRLAKRTQERGQLRPYPLDVLPYDFLIGGGKHEISIARPGTGSSPVHIFALSELYSCQNSNLFKAAGVGGTKEQSRKDYLEKTFARFDLVIDSGTLAPLDRLLKSLR